MPYLLLMYLVITWFVLVGLFRIGFTTSTSIKIASWIYGIGALLTFATLLALVFAFFYEPHSYWRAYDLDFNLNILDDYSSKIGDADLWKILFIPYFCLAQFCQWYVLIWSHHFTWSLLFTHLISLRIIIDVAKYQYRFNRLADPDYGWKFD